MITSHFESPFMVLISELIEHETHFVFAGKFSRSGQEYEVRESGIDLLTASLLFGLSFGYDYVFETCDVQLRAWEKRLTASYQAELKKSVNEELTKLHSYEFALLWTPPGLWAPRLISSAIWDDQRVCDELTHTILAGMNNLHKHCLKISPRFESVNASGANGELVMREFDTANQNAFTFDSLFEQNSEEE